MKKYILGLLTGIIITAVVSVSATILYNANEVEFTPDDPNWNVNNLEDALNDLYQNKGGLSSNMTIEEVYSGHSISTGTTITDVDDYKYYFVIMVEVDSYSGMDDFKNNLLNIAATNSTLVELGNTWRQRNGYEFTLGYLLFPDGSGNDIVLSHRGVDSMAVFGIK